MNKLVDLILDALNDGINRELLLLESNLPDDIFTLKLEWGSFDPHESRAIRKAIKEWRAAV